MPEISWWVAPVIAAVLGALFTLLILKFSCRHPWELVDKTEFAAPWDSLRDGQSYYNHDFKWLMTRTVILALRCPKCGAAKIEKVTNT